MFRRILVCVESSANSEHVFESALTLAQHNEGRLMLVHVLSGDQEDSPTLPDCETGYSFPVISSDNDEYYQHQWKTYQTSGLRLIQDFAKKAEVAGVMTESTQSIGSVGRLICETADTWKADLVISGRRGRTTLSELLLGSASNYILHHAPCSVLIVQPQQLEGEIGNLQTPELTHVT